MGVGYSTAKQDLNPVTFKQTLIELIKTHHDTPFGEQHELFPSILDFSANFEDICAIFTPTFTKNLLTENFEGSCFFIKKVFQQVCHFSLLNTDTVLNADHKVILNSLRIITRIIPFIYEEPALASQFRRLFWKRFDFSNNRTSSAKQTEDSEITANQGEQDSVDMDEGKEKVDTEEATNSGIVKEFTPPNTTLNSEDVSSHEDSSDALAAGKVENAANKPEIRFPREVDSSVEEQWWLGFTHELLGAQLMNALFRLCFVPGFTLVSSAKIVSSKSPPIWNVGVGAPEPMEYSADIDRCRGVVLRCIISLCSGRLFVTQKDLAFPESGGEACDDRFLRYAVSGLCPHSSALFLSLLNTVLAYDPVGWGLPFNYTVVSDRQAPLMEFCLHLLLVLLDYKILASRPRPEAHPPLTSPQSADPADSNRPDEDLKLFAKNVFHEELLKVRREQDLARLFTQLARLFTATLTPRSTLLPGALKDIPIENELSLFLWHILDASTFFVRQFLTHTQAALDILCVLLFHMYEGRHSRSHSGFIHLSLFIILLLSGERGLGIVLNAAYPEHLPTSLPAITGSHADLLIFVLSRLVVDGAPTLAHLYETIVTIMTNISPYIKPISLLAADKALSLLAHFSSPSQLCERPSVTYLLVEFVANLIQYQYENSTQMIYCLILRNKLIKGIQLLDAQAVFFPPTSAEGVASDDSGAQSTPVSEETLTLRIAQMKKFEDWRASPTFMCLIRALSHLIPQIETFCIHNGVIDQEQVVAYLNRSTLVGILPQPHKILVRKYSPQPSTSAWLTTYLWSSVFMKTIHCTLFTHSNIKLFQVTTSN